MWKRQPEKRICGGVIRPEQSDSPVMMSPIKKSFLSNAEAKREEERKKKNLHEEIIFSHHLLFSAAVCVWFFPRNLHTETVTDMRICRFNFDEWNNAHG